MIFVLDVAADGFGARLFWFFAGEKSGDGVFQIVLGRVGTIFAESEIAIIDAATVGEFALRIEDGAFRGDGGAGGFDEFVSFIAEEICGEMEIVTVRGNFGVRVGGVWINDIERDFVGRKFVGESFDFGR